MIRKTKANEGVKDFRIEKRDFIKYMVFVWRISIFCKIYILLNLVNHFERNNRGCFLNPVY